MKRMGAKVFRHGPMGRCLLLSLLWIAGSCAINVRKGPNLPAESKSSASTNDATVGVTPDQQKAGRALYERYCADCHNSFDKTTKRGASTVDIMRAIARVPEMDNLDKVKVSDIQAISEALKK